MFDTFSSCSLFLPLPLVPPHTSPFTFRFSLTLSVTFSHSLSLFQYHFRSLAHSFAFSFFSSLLSGLLSLCLSVSLSFSLYLFLFLHTKRHWSSWTHTSVGTGKSSQDGGFYLLPFDREESLTETAHCQQPPCISKWIITAWISSIFE